MFFHISYFMSLFISCYGIYLNFYVSKLNAADPVSNSLGQVFHISYFIFHFMSVDMFIYVLQFIKLNLNLKFYVSELNATDPVSNRPSPVFPVKFCLILDSAPNNAKPSNYQKVLSVLSVHIFSIRFHSQERIQHSVSYASYAVG